MSQKTKIEIDADIYNLLKKQWEEGRVKAPQLFPFETVEAFIENILKTFAKSSEQLQGMESKMADILNMFGGNMDDFDLGKIFGKDNQPKKEEKNEKPVEKKFKS